MPLPTDARKHARSLARDDIYQQLSNWIIEGHLAPEEALRDQDIAAQLGVSRTPVREALRRLEDEGLVETALNRWTRVAPLRFSQAHELYPMVEALEILALRLAAPHLTDQDLRDLQTYNEQLRAALSLQNAVPIDPVQAVALDTAFHDTWISRAGNLELERTLLSLKRKLRRIELAYFNFAASGLASVEEHAALLQALEQGDAKQAVQALQLNWQGSLRRLGNGLGQATY